MEQKQLIRFLASLALLAVGMSAQAVLPSGADSSMLLGAALDAGHIPLFGAFALIALRLSRSTLPGSSIVHFGAAAALVVIAGLGTEALQKFGARDAGWSDFLRDLIGGAAALLLAWFAQESRSVVRGACALLAVLLLVAGFAEFVQVVTDYRRRDDSFPLIAGFEADWEPRFVRGLRAELVRAAAPWDGSPAGRLTLRLAKYSALTIREPFPDWRGHEEFAFRVWSEREMDLTVRVHDRRHDQSYLDRFNREIAIAPGLNDVRIPLEAIANGPRDRRLNLAEVAGVAIIAEDPEEQFTLWFDELRLVGD